MGKTIKKKRSRFTEVGAILLFALGLYLLISFLSYSSADPTLFDSPSDSSPVANLGGRIGANLAEAGFQLLGLAAPLLPFLFFISGWNRFRKTETGSSLSLSMGGILLFLGLCTALQTLVGVGSIPGQGHNGGGLVGHLLTRWLLPAFSRGGLLLLALVFLIVGFLVATRLSLREVSAAFRNRFGKWMKRLRVRIARRVEARRRDRMREAVIRKHREMTSGEMRVPAKAARAKGPVKTRILRKDSQPSKVPATQSPLPFREAPSTYALPPLSLLEEPVAEEAVDDKELVEIARKITSRFREFGVEGSVQQIHPGPVVTTFEFKPEPGIKYNRITGLTEELCLAVQAEAIRIDRISGKSTIGIEVPNAKREMITLREILASPRFMNSPSRLTMALGRRIHGEPYLADLATMPHLLIAGATGSGKSVTLNAMISSILFKATPDEVKFIMIDTKRLELGFYQDIPHLLTPVVTDPKKAATALRWATHQMEQRYRQLADCGVRSLEQYNQLLLGDRRPATKGKTGGEGAENEPIPYLVVVIDELADLMITSGREVEESITRLAQMARAVGIHLIISTQRPSVDVITGVIKANFPCRIALRVSTKVDSRTILDGNGAEQLLGNGDMLFMPPGSARLIRLHAPMLTEVELARLVRHLSRQGKPHYDQSVTRERPSKKAATLANADDSAYSDAVRTVVQSGQASISYLQRRLRLGYARAARLVDRMESEGIVGPPDGSRTREILVGEEFLTEWHQNQMEEG